MPGESFTLTSADGFELAADLFEPPGPPRAAVVVASAMAVPRRLYAGFAEYLRDAGIAALTFDYRGIGGSRPRGPLRHLRASLHDWGERDLAAAIRWLAARHPRTPLLLVGHSAGGQLAGLTPESDRLSAILAVASQSGYWRLWPRPLDLGMLALWHAIPVFVPLVGRLPMSTFGLGEDVPPGVALEWARWGRHPEYVLSYAASRADALYARLSVPLRAYAISDDRYAPPSTVEGLLRMYPRTRSELRVITPASIGARQIGHFGFFRDRFRDTLWREARDWLSSAAPAEAGSA